MVLVDGLGLEPSAELQAIERGILRHDPSLAARAPQAREEASPRLDQPVRRARRATWIAATVISIGAVVALTVLAVTRSGKSKDIRIAANGVGVIEHGKVVAAGALGASPNSIAVGAGSVWVTNTDEHTVSRISPDTGNVLQTIPVGSGASGIAADDHAVWVANSLDSTVSRIDPRTNAVVQTIAAGSAPAAVALTRGSVWVTDEDDQTISQFDSRTGKLIARLPLGAAPHALAV